jgi:glycosyltransferase involved in cell wall biosynthesis
MYLQVPVITTRDGGGCAEVVEDNDGGMLVDYGDQEALGRAILGFRVDERFRQVQGAKGRARVERKFVAAIMIKGYADLYRRMSSASLAMEKS